ncbi:hypothetical protein ACFQ3B_22820 [Stackebrandtia endophytica]|nr:hypothetical protein [Stackebrandtia endophytica]
MTRRSAYDSYRFFACHQWMFTVSLSGELVNSAPMGNPIQPNG